MSDKHPQAYFLDSFSDHRGYKYPGFGGREGKLLKMFAEALGGREVWMWAIDRYMRDRDGFGKTCGWSAGGLWGCREKLAAAYAREVREPAARRQKAEARANAARGLADPNVVSLVDRVAEK
jgi:hypothetical protein